MPWARPYNPPTPSTYAPACRRPMSKLSYDHPPKSVCTLSADNERIVGNAMYEQPSSSLVGTSPLRCWFLADEARRGAFSSGLPVQAGEGGGGESGAHSYHRPVLVRSTKLCCWRATIPAPNSGSPSTTRPHTCRPDDQSQQQFCHNTHCSLTPSIFVPPKSHLSWFFPTPCGSFLRLAAPAQ